MLVFFSNILLFIPFSPNEIFFNSNFCNWNCPFPWFFIFFLCDWFLRCHHFFFFPLFFYYIGDLCVFWPLYFKNFFFPYSLVLRFLMQLEIWPPWCWLVWSISWALKWSCLPLSLAVAGDADLAHYMGPVIKPQDWRAVWTDRYCGFLACCLHGCYATVGCVCDWLAPSGWLAGCGWQHSCCVSDLAAGWFLGWFVQRRYLGGWMCGFFSLKLLLLHRLKGNLLLQSILNHRELENGIHPTLWGDLGLWNQWLASLQICLARMPVTFASGFFGSLFKYVFFSYSEEKEVFWSEMWIKFYLSSIFG